MEKELEKELWKKIENLRGNISSEQYMHVVIGILFLKKISDKYDKKIKEIKEEFPSDWKELILIKDFLLTFFVPKKANWNYVSNFASSKEIGSKIDQAFLELENANFELKGLFDKNYNREELDQYKLGQVVSGFSDINIEKFKKIYELFIKNFFEKQGKKGGEFYAPKSITKLLVDIIDPAEGTLYDPACGDGKFFIQSKYHIIKNKADFNDLLIYGQEYQDKIWKLAKINLLLNDFAIENIHLGLKSANTFLDDQHKNETNFDYIIANPPFNMENWGLEELKDDPRWKWGELQKNNANYAWISHMLYKLGKKGRAGIVLANGSLSASGKSEIKFRKNLIFQNKIDAIITLPSKLFYTTGIPACLWILNNDKKSNNFLMIDASEFEGNMISKIRELTDNDNEKILNVYKKHLKCEKIEIADDRFAKIVSQKEIEENDFSFVPRRYIGFVEEQIDHEKIKKQIKSSSIELENLLNEFEKMIPKVKKSIKDSLKFKNDD